MKSTLVKIGVTAFVVIGVMALVFRVNPFGVRKLVTGQA